MNFKYKINLNTFIIYTLIFILLPAILTGCKGAPANDDPAASADYGADVLVIIDAAGQSDYTIVRSDYVNTYTDAAVLFKKTAENLTGVQFKITTDWRDNEILQKEILIGSTVREGVYFDPIDRDELDEEGYVIMVKDERLIISGSNSESTKEAVEYFMETHTNANGSVTVPKDYYYKKSQEYAVKKITINGTELEKYKIIYPSAYKPAEKKAVEELQIYIRKASGIKIEAETDAAASSAYEIIVGNTNRENDSAIKIDRTGLGEEGFEIAVSKDGKIYIAGGGVRGTLYGTYEFLEKYIGWKFLAIDTDKIAPAEEIKIESLTNRQTTPLEFRDPYWTANFNAAIAAKLKVNSMNSRDLDDSYGGSMGISGSFVHTMQSLLGYDQSTQPCMSDPEIIEKTIQAVRDMLVSYPNAKIISVSQNDNGNYCKCDRCKAINNEEGSTSGTLIRYVNAVAEALEGDYPDLAIHTLAYQYTRKPPKLTKPRENVIIQLCTIECCFNHALDDPSCPRNKTLKNDIEAWKEICDRIYIWDYTTNFAHYIAPFPNFDILRQNVRFFCENNVTGIFEQGNYQGPCGEFGELRAYLLARLLWNPAMSEEEYYNHMDSFLEGYYGAGWKNIREYIDYTTNMSSDKGSHFAIYDSPDVILDHTGFLNNYDTVSGWFDKAEKAAANETETDHIRKSRLQITYVHLGYTFDKRYYAGTEEEKAAALEENTKFKEELIKFNVRKNEGIGVPVNADVTTSPFEWTN